MIVPTHFSEARCIYAASKKVQKDMKRITLSHLQVTSLHQPAQETLQVERLSVLLLYKVAPAVDGKVIVVTAAQAPISRKPRDEFVGSGAARIAQIRKKENPPEAEIRAGY
jgi:hypothetical protein